MGLAGPDSRAALPGRANGRPPVLMEDTAPNR
jgi:hypothetical protein